MTDRERSEWGNGTPPDLQRWSDISCEEIKTRHLNGANGERGPSCTIGGRRRKKTKKKNRRSALRDESHRGIKSDILPVI